MKTILAFTIIIVSLLIAWVLRPSESVATFAQDTDKKTQTQKTPGQAVGLSNESTTQPLNISTSQSSNDSTRSSAEPRLSTLWSLDPPRHPTLTPEPSTAPQDKNIATQPANRETNADSIGQALNNSTPITSEPSSLDPRPSTLPLDSIARLANSNLPAAITWIASLPESESKDGAILAVGYESARGEPVAAIELALSVPPSRDRAALVEHALNQWTVTDLAAAKAWVAQVEDPELRQKLVADLAVASAEHDPSSAAALTANSLPPGEDQDRAAVAIVQRWVQKSPLDAAAWVAQFPESPARDAAVENLVALWTVQDRQAALNWVQQLSDDNLRTLAFNTYSQTLSRPKTDNISAPTTPILEEAETN